MKKELSITLLLGLLSFMWILTIPFSFPRPSQKQPVAATPSIQPTTPTPSSLPTQGQSHTPLPTPTLIQSNMISLAVLKIHNSQKDCWISVENRVYNVTSFLADHPGGKKTIIPTCGTDATNAFNTKNENQPHSAQAHQLLKEYYVGDLKQ